MKKFARCVLILILVTIISGVGGYFYENNTLTTMYTSTTQLYVVPGEENEATIRADNGGLKDDFVIIFKSGVVIQEAQKIAGTSENIAQYLTVKSPANSNIVEITCTNPDQNTAKQYVDAVARTALKTTSIIPVKSIQILSEGTSDNVSIKPDLYRNTLIIASLGAGICLVLEIVVMLLICAFRKPQDNSDDESEYEKYYGKYAALNAQEQAYIGSADEEGRHDSHEEKKVQETREKTHEQHEDMKDILEDFDEDYDDEALYDEDFYDNDEEESESKEPVTSNTPETENKAEVENEMETENIAETEDMTEAEDVTETKVMTKAEDVTETELITEAQDVEEADNVTETEVVEQAEDMTETKVVEQAENMTETEVVEQAENMTEDETVDDVQETENPAVAEAAVSEESEISEETVAYEEAKEDKEIADIINETADEEKKFKEAAKKSSVQILGIIKK